MPQKQLLKRSSFINKPFFFVLISSFLLLTLLLVGNNYFLIKEISIKTEDKLSIKGLNTVYNTNIIFLNEEKLLSKLFELNPLVKITEIKKEYPRKLTIWATAEKPLASLQAVSGYFLLTEDGRVVAKVKTINNKLILVNYYRKIDFSLINTGQILPYSDLTTALGYLKRGLDLDLAINTLDIGGEDMIAFKLRDKEIVFSLKKDKEKQIFQLDAIIKKFRASGQNYKRIDLRFDKPVIQF